MRALNMRRSTAHQDKQRSNGCATGPSFRDHSTCPINTRVDVLLRRLSLQKPPRKNDDCCCAPRLPNLVHDFALRSFSASEKSRGPPDAQCLVSIEAIVRGIPLRGNDW